ncbi:outer membrane protein [Methylobacterium sp. E-045]|uniref:outer membrane protein n=1 Tax=Methylobacterium sp. E-045 TaxID=2836575 RepID=UPI001FBA0D86|nr:porin family protein [Methylobacterium sp. E-045]MCJ2128909.1 porin family protein [Methylobacterium sp. E-045]
MKRLLLATTVLAGLTAVASAADLPRRAAPPVFVPVPVFTWTGFYAGINAGYAFDAGKEGPNSFAVPGRFTATGVPQVATFRNDSQDGFTGGAQIGYNYQFTPGSGVVVGIEADAQYLDFGAKRRDSGIVAAPGFAINDPRSLSSLDYFGTVRGRLGYAFDRTLVYGTGGFAYGAGSTERSFGGFRGNDDFRTGYAVGGGIEYALPTDSFFNFFRASAVTLKVEGLYVNLDRGNRNQGAFIIDTTDNSVVRSVSTGRRDDEFAVVRAGLNYKFGTY